MSASASRTRTISRLNPPARMHPESNASLRPHGTPTHGRGRRDSLDLQRRTLSFPSSCRLSGAFHAQVLRPRGVRRRLANSAANDVAFRLSEQRRHPETLISRLNSRPARPLPTLRRRPRERPTHGSGPPWIATSFRCRELSSPAPCRFIPALSDPGPVFEPNASRRPRHAPRISTPGPMGSRFSSASASLTTGRG
jgi:hypothetical protein